MLYQIGPVAFEGNGGPSAEGVDRKTEAALADKGMLGGLPGHEWTGWSGDLTISGKVLPYHLGGLDAIEDLHGWCASGTKVPVVRGDGRFMGWYAIKSVSEKHGQLSRTGVGYEVTWDVSLLLQSKPDGASIQIMVGLVSTLIERMVLAASGGVANAITSLFGRQP